MNMAALEAMTCHMCGKPHDIQMLTVRDKGMVHLHCHQEELLDLLRDFNNQDHRLVIDKLESVLAITDRMRGYFSNSTEEGKDVRQMNARLRSIIHYFKTGAYYD